VAVGAFQRAVVAVDNRSYGGAGYPVEIECFSAVGAGKSRCVVWSVPGQENKQDYDTYSDCKE